MVTLRGDYIYLRALELEDLDYLYEIENNEEFWELSATQVPFSKYMLRQYLENAHKDIYEVKQLRLVICNKADEVIGLIHLFDFEPTHKKFSKRDLQRRTFISIHICTLKEYYFLLQL